MAAEPSVLVSVWSSSPLNPLQLLVDVNLGCVSAHVGPGQPENFGTPGYTATEIDPQARGVSWLRAEDGIPRRVKAAYLTDEQIIDLSAWAAQARSTYRATDDQLTAARNVVPLHRGEDAAMTRAVRVGRMRRTCIIQAP